MPALSNLRRGKEPRARGAPGRPAGRPACLPASLSPGAAGEGEGREAKRELFPLAGFEKALVILKLRELGLGRRPDAWLSGLRFFLLGHDLYGARLVQLRMMREKGLEGYREIWVVSPGSESPDRSSGGAFLCFFFQPSPNTKSEAAISDESLFFKPHCSCFMNFRVFVFQRLYLHTG